VSHVVGARQRFCPGLAILTQLLVIKINVN
jgi:hypothetical protein